MMVMVAAGDGDHRNGMKMREKERARMWLRTTRMTGSNSLWLNSPTFSAEDDRQLLRTESSHKRSGDGGREQQEFGVWEGRSSADEANT